MDNRPPAAPPVADPSPELLPVCPECGYDLRGIPSDRCPECGLQIDREVVSRIPWVHRARIGRVRAYWRTVWMATFRTDRLAEEVRRPVSLRDGQTFRWVTVLLAWLPLGAAAFIAARAWQELFFGWSMSAASNHVAPSAASLAGGSPVDSLPLGLTLPWLVGLTTPGALPAAALAALVLVTGVGSYFFHPRRLPVNWQDRAVSISYFACAPLSLTGVPLLAMALGSLKDLGLGPDMLPPNLELAAGFGILTALGLIPLGVVLAMLRLVKSAAQAGWGRSVGVCSLIVLLWVLSLASCAVAVPWVVGYVRLMVASFFL